MPDKRAPLKPPIRKALAVFSGRQNPNDNHFSRHKHYWEEARSMIAFSRVDDILHSIHMQYAEKIIATYLLISSLVA
ncbi:hypothetical protein AAC387_Pa02g4813 [Persea americana]